MKIADKKEAFTNLEINRWLTLGVIAGPVLFALAWLILGLLRPGYSLVSQPISNLGIGSNALAMNAAFVLMGLFMLAGVIAIFRGIGDMGPVQRWSCMILLSLSPIGAIMDGIFTFNSLFLHFIGFLLGCASPVLSFLVTGLLLRSIPGWRRFGGWLILGSPLTMVLMYLFMRTFDPAVTEAGLGTAGLTERIAIIEFHSWFAAMGWMAFKQQKYRGNTI